MVLGYLLISSFRALSPRRYSYTYLSLWCISFEDSFDRKNYEIYKNLFLGHRIMLLFNVAENWRLNPSSTIPQGSKRKYCYSFEFVKIKF